MSDLLSILPVETRKHFINMKNVRDAHERELDAKRLDELNGMAAEAPSVSLFCAWGTVWGKLWKRQYPLYFHSQWFPGGYWFKRK